MSHEIEKAVFSMSEGAGWTGLGLAIEPAIAKDPRKIAKLLGATWKVESIPAYIKTAKGFKQVPNAAVQVRSDNGEALSITSADRYHVQNRQPVDVLEAFREDLKKERLEISHAAVLKGGRVIAVSALLPPEHDMKINGKDLLKSYITLSTGYDRAHGTKATKGTIRVVCANTLEMSLNQSRKDGQIKTVRASTRVTESGLSELVANIKHLEKIEREAFDAYANTRMKDADVARFFADVLEIKLEDLGKSDKQGNKLISPRAENMLTRLTEAYKDGPGARGASGTLWGAVNAVTYYATHEKTCRDTNDDGAMLARVSSNLVGDSAALKRRAVALASARIAA